MSLFRNWIQSTGGSDHDSDGCQDDSEDDDDDNDQLNDTLDSCPKGMTGWIRTNASDLDDDGCMDALEDYDDDNDGFEDYEDYCSRIPGNSTFEFEKGCPDADGDGRPDILDPFKDDPTEWSDTDGDDVGDNSDAFPQMLLSNTIQMATPMVMRNSVMQEIHALQSLEHLQSIDMAA